MCADSGVFQRVPCARGQIGIAGGEAAEVEFAEESGGDGVEPFQIDTPRVWIYIARKKWRADLMGGGLDGEYAVLVSLGDGGVAGMKFR